MGLLFGTVLIAALLAIGACGGLGGSVGEAPSTEESTGEESAAGGAETTGSETTGETTEAGKPYTAIVPP